MPKSNMRSEFSNALPGVMQLLDSAVRDLSDANLPEIKHQETMQQLFSIPKPERRATINPDVPNMMLHDYQKALIKVLTSNGVENFAYTDAHHPDWYVKPTWTSAVRSRSRPDNRKYIEEDVPSREPDHHSPGDLEEQLSRNSHSWWVLAKIAKK